MPTITAVLAQEILDSRGLPTVSCKIWLDTGHVAEASAPGGTSVDKYEAHELRDNDPDRMRGKGVLKAVENVNTVIAPALIGKDPTQQEEIDQILINLDGTPNKEKLGSNGLIAVSQAVLKAGALASNLVPYMYIQQKYQLTATLNIPPCIYSLMNGGEHGADNLDLQDFQVIPASHVAYPMSLNMGVTMFHTLEQVLISKGATHSTGLAGGFTPHLYTNADAFGLMIETAKATPFTFAQDLFLGVDVSAGSIIQNGKYPLKDKAQPYSPADMLDFYRALRSVHHVVYLEDPFDADDHKSWQTLTAELGPTTKIAGDSLTVTNIEKTREAIDKKLCNTLVVKPNQVGTMSEVIEVVQLARQNGWAITVSHRSGETNDDIIADLAVGIGADYAKFGAPNRGERIAKYNRLLDIYWELERVKHGTTV